MSHTRTADSQQDAELELLGS